MVDNSNMPHPKCLGSQVNPGTEPKTCEKGPKLAFEYLPTSKTLHCVRTACMAFPKFAPFKTPNCWEKGTPPIFQVYLVIVSAQGHSVYWNQNQTWNSLNKQGTR